MTEEQRARYDDYRMPGLATDRAGAKTSPAARRSSSVSSNCSPACAWSATRPAILDPTCRVSPKLEELEGIFEDLLAEDGRKIIIFSEWERMLTMVRELLGEMGFDAAWHTGSLPQDRRRAEINRFKQDPRCRVFLSTDSGSVGLNLQVASAVVNVDLPWNPAKLEQRIARAWRKNQMRSVAVINLVTENSIEHSILHLLGQKQALADGVLDGDGRSRGAQDAFGARRLDRAHAGDDGRAQAIGAARSLARGGLCRRSRGPSGRQGFERRIAKRRRRPPKPAGRARPRYAGARRRNRARRRWTGRGVHRQGRVACDAAPGFVGSHQFQPGGAAPASLRRPAGRRRRNPRPTAGRAAKAMAEADRWLRMAKVLSAGGFADEAPALLGKSIGGVAQALSVKARLGRSDACGRRRHQASDRRGGFAGGSLDRRRGSQVRGGGRDGKQHRTADRRDSANFGGREEERTRPELGRCRIGARCKPIARACSRESSGRRRAACSAAAKADARRARSRPARGEHVLAGGDPAPGGGARPSAQADRSAARTATRHGQDQHYVERRPGWLDEPNRHENDHPERHGGSVVGLHPAKRGNNCHGAEGLGPGRCKCQRNGPDRQRWRDLSSGLTETEESSEDSARCEHVRVLRMRDAISARF